jgi:uncharacterized phage protein gp47/JayE
MTAAALTYPVKTPYQSRTDILRTIKNGWTTLGIGGAAGPNVGPGSPVFVQATALANELAAGGAVAIVNVDGCMPDTATGANLDRWGTILKRPRRGAVPSHGNVTVYTTAPGGSNFPNGAQLTDETGQSYSVISGGTKTNEQTVGIVANAGGTSTNHVNGDTLSWVDQPAFSGPNVTVGALGGTDGLVDGADSEIGNDELYRPRIIYAFSNPDKDGNEARVADLAVQSSNIVGSCYVYPALQGAGTVFAVVCAIPQASAPFTSTSKSRAVPAGTIAGAVLPFLQGALGGQPYVQVSSSTDVPTTLAIQVFLPSSPGASPPGPGGGWLDASPWPMSVGATPSAVGIAPVHVTAISSTTVFTVNATTPPASGVSRIACLSTADWQLYTATVLSYTGTSGAYTLTIDTPMPYVALNEVIFPQSVNQDNYVAAVFAAFAGMGPGEWSTNAAVLARAFRHPSTALNNPSSLSNAWLKPLINAGPEVGDALFIYRGTATGPLVSPFTPSASDDVTIAPGVFTPGPTGWYQT